ncbi:MAG TPA: DUF350 domain-containing protein [Elusimicrobiota bacterium]|nr:DUF350 domain-containing protein [Elusimicrobiota bacterium]
MSVARALVGFVHFGLALVLSVVVIYVTYRVFILANPDFDMEAEIRNGNTAVGALVGAILVAAAMILKNGMSSVMTMVRLRLLAPAESGFSLERLVWLAAAHLTLSLLMAVLTISITLRAFGRLSRRRGWRPGEELQKNNVAVGVLLAAVVIIAAMYVGDGVGALSSSLLPQPTMGHIQIMR